MRCYPPRMTHPGTLDLRSLSRRGRRLVEHPPEAEYLLEHFRRAAEGYDPVARPDGYIPLCIAENKLVADLLLPKMAACRDVPAGALGYDAMTGSLAFRQQLARFTGRAFLGRAPLPEQAAVPAGGDVAAGAVPGAVLTSLDAGTAVVKNPARMR